MKKVMIPLLVAAVVAAIVLALKYRQSGPRTGPDMLRVSGNIEATTVDVSFRIAGWVKERPVDEGYAVKAGDLVAKLDDTELAQQVAQNKGAVSQAEAALAELLAGSRPEEKAAAAANVASAQASAAKAKVDLARAERLRATDTISAQEYDAARAAFDVAAAQAASAEATRELVDIGPRQEEIDQARSRLAQAQQALAISETRQAYATLPVPTTGVVLSKNVEPGEYVVPGTPVVTIGDLANVWLRGYVSETDLGRIKLGQSARVSTDTYPGKVYEGRVGFISSEAEFTPKNVETQKERVKLVYRIKIDVPNPSMELKPGMPADAEIDLRSGG